MKRLMLIFGVSAILAVPAGAIGQESGAGVQGYYVDESVEVADHHVFPMGAEVDGATILVRDFRNKVVRMDVTTAALEPDTAYSIWLAVFNSPEHCGTPHNCLVSDLGNPDVRASVFWGGGLISDGDGHGSTTMTLQPGRTGRELFANTPDLGLQDIRRAHIHVVLRSHGPIGVAGSVASQIGTAWDACPGTGCFNAFASVHVPN
jgi:hypothetical protein